MPAKITAKPATRARCAPDSVRLPRHMRLTEDERSSVAQWMRLRRNPTLWTGALIQALLDLDSNQPDVPTYEQVHEMVKELEMIYGLFDVIREAGRGEAVRGIIRPHKSKYPVFNRHFEAAVKKFARGCYPVIPESEEDEFNELFRLWRREHPEPLKRASFPKGHLGRRDDDD